MSALRDDPNWVLGMYEEAKELLDDVAAEPAVPQELRERAESFRSATYMDVCTTFDRHCACNDAASRNLSSTEDQ